MPAIEISYIVKKYSSLLALDDVSLSIEEGEFFGLLGPNGAGKTTLISILAGLCRADAGSVRVLGHDVVKDFKFTRQSIGVVPQELVFDPFFTVREVLRLQSGYFGLSNNDAWIDEVMGNLDLTDKANANMRTLSGGMKRRVLVAQALVHKPAVIVLDEPTAGVDVELRQALWKFIARLNQQGHTIILTTHYLEEAQALCNRIAMLKSGKLVAQGSTTEFVKRIAGSQLIVKLASGSLPVGLHDLLLDRTQLQVGNQFTLRLSDVNEVESVLANIRQHGAILDEVQLKQADLEDVFLQIMGAQK